MTTATTSEPRWASAPGESVLAALKARGETVEDLADALGLPDSVARGIVTGATDVTQEIAQGLVDVIGASVEFWMRREEQYRDSLRWLHADQLAESLPLKQMSEFGWLPNSMDWRERASACLDFFSTEDAEEFNQRYRPILEAARFRTSAAYESNELVLAAWLRRAEIVAAEIPTDEWSSTRLRDAIPAMRALTRHRDPGEFIPKLQKLAAGAGVAVVLVRAPSGCTASGAALTTERGQRVVALSGRYLADDHLWFTFFHEIGHLLLHEDEQVFVDEINGADADANAIEQEANEFAVDTLIPGGVDLLKVGKARGPSRRDIVRFAARVGVSPGIVAGQLQHLGVIQRNQQNPLKRRYRWEGPMLRAASPRT